MKKVGILILLSLLLLNGCVSKKEFVSLQNRVSELEQQFESPTTSTVAQSTQNQITTTPQATATETAAATPEVIELPENLYDAMTTMGFSTILQNVNTTYYGYLDDSIGEIRLSENIHDGKTYIQYLFFSNDYSIEELAKKTADHFNITFSDTNDNQFHGEKDGVIISVLEYGDSPGVCFDFLARDYPDMNQIDYYTKAIKFPSVDERATLESVNVYYSISENVSNFVYNYVLPNNESGSIKDNYITLLKEYPGYSFDKEWNQYHAILAPGQSINFEPLDDNRVQVNINYTTQTIFDSQFMLDIMKDPLNNLFTQRSKDLYSLIDGDKNIINVQKKDGLYTECLHVDNVRNSNTLEQAILDLYKPKNYSGSILTDFYIEENDYSLELYGQNLPDSMMVGFDHYDQQSLDMMADIFSNFPLDAFPPLPDATSIDYYFYDISYQFPYNNQNNEQYDERVDFSIKYVIEGLNYSQLCNYFKNYMGNHYDTLDETQPNERETTLSGQHQDLFLDVSLLENVENDQTVINMSVHQPY